MMIKTIEYTGTVLLFQCVIIIFLCMSLLSACKDRGEQSLPEKPYQAGSEEPEKASFVERQLCIDCHEDKYSQWTGSHHDLAMDVASDETVLGDFNNSKFTHYGVTSTFYKKDGNFFIRTDGADSQLHDYKIMYVFGVDPLQQYLVEFPDGRIQVPDIGWDDRAKRDGGQRWVHLHPDEKITPKHIFHWTRWFLNWNYMCGECHTTNFQKNYDLESNTFKTTWTMIDVGCQACHGPGSHHVAWANAEEEPESPKRSYENKGLEVNLRAEDPDVQMDACARCHSRRNRLRKDYQYGQPLMDYYVPQVLIDPFYYPDGQILDEVYVYGSFIQAKKYQHGVRCTDCHNPHTARLHIYGNELCTGCHSSPPPVQYETLRDREYNSPTHHFHKEDSEGSLCVECHMPETKYMIVDPRRDHKFLIPRPDLSVKLDIPNPCNRCHADKTAQWAADKIDEVHPDTRAAREKEVHVAEIFAAGQADRQEAGPGLIRIIRDRSRPPIIRATSIHILSRFRDEDSINATADVLADNAPLVRYEAVRAISALIPGIMDAAHQHRKYSLLVPLLKDPILAVRSETARVLTEVPQEYFDPQVIKDFEAALDEFTQRQEAIADRPEAHLNLGIMYENLGEDAMAETSYRTAIRLVNDFFPARFNLANFYNRAGRNREAEEQLREIITFDSNNGEAYYSLGLLLAEENRLAEAVAALGNAAQLLPDRARVHYNYSLSLRHYGRNEASLTAMLKAHQIDPRDPGIVQAIAVFYMQDQQWPEALPFAQKLVELVPGDEASEQMLKRIKQEMKNKKENDEQRTTNDEL
jgi:Flp pilus assembly protein TadD